MQKQNPGVSAGTLYLKKQNAESAIVSFCQYAGERTYALPEFSGLFARTNLQKHCVLFANKSETNAGQGCEFRINTEEGWFSPAERKNYRELMCRSRLSVESSSNFLRIR
jgi:hypothetical protein